MSQSELPAVEKKVSEKIQNIIQLPVTENKSEKSYKLSEAVQMAETKKLFFYTTLDFGVPLWLSPREVKVLHQRGSVWINRSWVLRDPSIRIYELERDINLLQQEQKDFKSEVQILNSANGHNGTFWYETKVKT